MQIVVNARHLRKGKLDGIGWFSFQILKRITRNHPEVHFIFLFDRNYSEEFVFSENITPLIVSPAARHPVLFYAWNHISVSSLLKRINPDLYISPDGMIPLHAPCKTISVIHDINFKHNPKDLPLLTSKFYNHFYPKYAQKADHVITVSNYSKSDIAQSYSVKQSKISVVYNAINDTFFSIPEEQKQLVRNSWTKACPYFIYVGSIHTRKNIVRLLQSFELFKTKNSNEIKLVLVGSVFWGKNEINRQLKKMRFSADVIFTGRLSDQKLNELMNAALALTYIPYFEGFGIPLLEAMAVDVPIICSTTTSLPEVVSDAAILVDPFNPKEVAVAMEKIVLDDSLRSELIEKGRKRRLQFSWDKSAEDFWKCIQHINNCQ